MSNSFWCWLGLLLFSGVLAVRAEDKVFSGPQPGELTRGFKVTAIHGTGTEPEANRDPIAANQGKPLALVFVHSVERSLVPLLRVIDEYGARQQEQMHSEIVFLSGDAIAGRDRIKAVQGSLKLKSQVGLSVDGAEGPGNYGLNKGCLMTIVLAMDNRVITNFALVQPGIADAPGILAALAKLSGEAQPPTAESLLPRNQGQARLERPTTGGAAGKEPFPGAVPSDEKLQGLLRRFIRPTNDNATVDILLEQVKAHISSEAGLRQQAIDGWTRVLYFGERYGTPYSRKVGTDFLESLKQDTKATKPEAKP